MPSAAGTAAAPRPFRPIGPSRTRRPAPSPNGNASSWAICPAPLRATLAPAAPFFRLGLVGATIPGLAIKGEIGIQIGEINAFTLGLLNFALLVALAVVLSRPRLRGRILEKLGRGRYRAPREDEYTR